ncbi:Similar to NUS1: Dehydrodolichyl diphosphate synthase complex subunit NUS1 (Homo sapiens) [Cotesia congregata]|uniref:ditrans,polycis-polyprenyl diphosphate synthase [(2E,6E)-farnesyldiphosphate specific] n=1 Tax=Cotesia congregata TaxID=51543 RepID=A0A8J2EJ32_COTCN|nr:Similar to NUS1: Dehydrodolichyl diphosphate synthase complex subunit NUS1 (Homo sapiens) [Cotesia congregata]
MKLFCRVLKLIHFIVTVLMTVYDYLITIKDNLINYLRPKTLKCIDTIVDVCDVSKLEKLPSHLVIVVASKDKVSFSDLAKIVGWCCTLGIPNITFYDREVPDPDLAIITGRTFSTFGLLPWHIRLTEFYNVPTHHNISPHKFINILEAFAKCHQRFGT